MTNRATMVMAVAAVVLAAGSATAQIRGLTKYKNEREGFALVVPRKWDAIPPQPDQLDTLAIWNPDRPPQGRLWRLEVLRFQPKGATTESGGESPASSDEDEDLSVAERIKRFREASRPQSFEDWYKRTYRKEPGEPAETIRVGDDEAKIYRIKDVWHETAMFAGVIHDGTYEWAVVYLAPRDEIIDERRPERLTKESRKMLSSVKSLRFFEPEREPVQIDPDASELDRKIEEVRRRLPRSWEVIPTPSKNYVVVHNIPRKKTRQLVFVKNIVRYLDHIREKYEELFPPRKEITAVSVVRVCQDREEYLQYGAPRGSAGYWSAADEELVIYDASGLGSGGGVADSYATLFHEAFHQYIYYAVGQISPHSWYNEGYGDYFSGSNPRNRFNIEPFDWRVPVVKKAAYEDSLVPLRKLVHYTQAQYYANPSVCYAQGWALIYFLHHSRAAKKNEGWRNILDVYFNTLCETRDKKKAVEAAFGQYSEDDWDELEAEYKKFIENDFKQ